MKILLGNGNLLIYIDKFSQIKDFYFPFVGQENHLDKHAHKIGVWCGGKLSWLDEKTWNITIGYKKDTLVGKIIAKNDDIGIELEINDVVHHEKDIYIRKINVRNLREDGREVRIFLSQYFSVYGSEIGNTAYFHPVRNAIIYYKNKRYFLISSSKFLDDYAIGKIDIHGMKGTYTDAEDGELSKNTIDHGSVDSVISFHFSLGKKAEDSFYYWVTAGKNSKEVIELNDYIAKNKPEDLINDTEMYWKRWVNEINIDIDEDILDLVKRSLLIIRANTDNRGGILASTDADMMKPYNDSYNYIWPRDAAFIAMVLDEAGYSDLSRNFFVFCSRIMGDGGYFLQKYNPNGSVGSSWHPWIKYGKVRLPIQEDETALVLYALGKHHEKNHDDAFIKSIYRNFILKAADFLYNFIEEGLPRESYDLWEEKFGTHTFTTCTVYAGLRAAAKLANVSKRFHDSKRYTKAAEEVKEAILSQLYEKNSKIFLRRKKNRSGKIYRDTKIDSSTGYGLHEFVFDPDDEAVASHINMIKEKLTCKTNIGGVARYEDDGYFRVSNEVPGNPWFICTLWLAQYYIKTARSVSDLDEVKKTLKWVVDRASPTGILSEQLNPLTGEQLSASPLVWSHSTFVETVLKYVKRLEHLRNYG